MYRIMFAEISNTEPSSVYGLLKPVMPKLTFGENAESFIICMQKTD